MLLNEEFIKLYEELSELNEAKADTQKLIDFAGENLADRFLAIKNRLKAPENDLYYWIKSKTPADLEHVVQEVENVKSNTQVKKDIAEQGAKLVCESAHWNIYHITTFEAAVKYGKDTKWCITGLENSGDKYWKEYKEKGADFYFLITKEKYDPRGRNSKFALALYEDEEEFYFDDGKDSYTSMYGYEVYDQQDYSVLLDDIPYINEVKIPGINLTDYLPITGRLFPCENCGNWMREEQYEDTTIYGDHLCVSCYNEYSKTEPAKAEELLGLSFEPTRIFKIILPKRFEELGSDVDNIIKVWANGRKNNLFKKFTEQKLVEFETGFIKNLEIFTGKTITLAMIQGKEELKL